MRKYKIFFSLITLIISFAYVTNQSSAQVYSKYFDENLYLNSSGNKVLVLQRILNLDPYTAVAQTGVGSAGRESNVYGELTKDAVSRFQMKYNIRPVDGNVGADTRVKLNEILVANPRLAGSSDTNTSTVSNTTTVPTAVVVSSSNFTRDLSVGSRGSDVNLLQRVLNADVDTIVSSSGVGSPGNETEYFGNATKAAVIVLQLKYGIEPAAGYVGPKTRVLLNSLIQDGILNSAASSMPTNSTLPSVDLKVNGSDTSVSVVSGSYVTLTWTSKNVTSCTSVYSAKSLSGTQQIQVNSASTYQISCSGQGGTVYDTVSVALYTPNTAYQPTYNPNYNYNDNTYGQNNYYNPAYGNNISYSSTTATKTGEASLLVNGKSNVNITRSEYFELVYDTAGLICMATSTPTSIFWNGPVNQEKGSVLMRGEYLLETSGGATAAQSGGVSVYGPGGEFIESGRSVGPLDGYADAVRFVKPGAQYPNNSYVSIEGSKCYIPNTAQITETCNSQSSALGGNLSSKTIKILKYGMSCYMPAVNTNVSTYYTSSSTIRWPIMKNVIVDVKNDSYGTTAASSISSAVSAITRFMWKPVSETDGKLVVLYGEEESNECEYEDGCSGSGMNITFDKDFTFVAGTAVDDLPDCNYPRIFYGNQYDNRTLELFAIGTTKVGFRLANKKISFTSSTVGTIRNPGEDTDHYAIANAQVTGEHLWRVEYYYSSSQVKLYQDNVLVGHWTFAIDSAPSGVTRINFPTWSPGIPGYNPAQAGDVDLNGSFVESSCRDSSNSTQSSSGTFNSPFGSLRGI